MAWTRSLRHVRHALDASARRIDCSIRVINAVARTAARRPVRAAQQLQQVSEWLVDAAAQLGRATSSLKDTTRRVEEAPEQAAGAPRLLVDVTLRWLETAARLNAVSIDLGNVFAPLADFAKNPDRDADVRPRIVGPPRQRWFLQYCPSSPGDRIRPLLTRRRRPALLRTVDAPKRLSRGRAPPFIPACLL